MTNTAWAIVFVLGVVIVGMIGTGWIAAAHNRKRRAEMRGEIAYLRQQVAEYKGRATSSPQTKPGQAPPVRAY